MTDQMTKAATMSIAPQVKAVPDTMTAAFDEFMEAFEAFRETNDQRLNDIERKMGADIVTRDKLDRIDRALDDNRRIMDDLALRKARPALGRKDALSHDAEEHKAAFEAYIRRGEEGALRDLEAKAFAGSSGADGGFLVPTETDGEIGRRMTAISPIRALATVRQVSTAVLKKPFAAGGLVTGWVSETAARPETATPKLSELSFPTMELYAMPAATQGLLDDAAVDVEAWIASEVDIAFAEQEAAAFIAGDGVNKPKGFLSYTSVANDSWSWGNIGYVATGVSAGFRFRRADGCAARCHLWPEGGPPPERRVPDEPQDAIDAAPLQGYDRRLPVAPARRRRPARIADGLSGDGGGRHAECRGQQLRHRLWRFPLRLSRRRSYRCAHPARSLFGQTLCAVLHHQARGRRRYRISRRSSW